MPAYRVIVQRVVHLTQEAYYTVEADSKEDADCQFLALCHNEDPDFEWETVETDNERANSVRIDEFKGEPKHKKDTT